MEGGARVERSAALRPSRKLFTLPRAVPPTGATTWVGIALVSLCLLYQLQPFVSVRVDVVWLPSSHTSQPGVPATGSADVMGTGQVAAPPSSQSHRAARVSAETRAAPARDAPAASAHVVGTPSQELTPQPPTHSTTPQGVVSQAATPPVEHGAVPEARSAVAQPTQGLLSPAHNVRVDWPFGGPSQLVLTSDQIVAQGVSYVQTTMDSHPVGGGLCDVTEEASTFIRLVGLRAGNVTLHVVAGRHPELSPETCVAALRRHGTDSRFTGAVVVNVAACGPPECVDYEPVGHEVVLDAHDVAPPSRESVIARVIAPCYGCDLRPEERTHIMAEVTGDASLWHRLCFFLLRREGRYITSHLAGATSIGCLDPHTTSGVFDGFEPGQHAFLLYAQDEAGQSVSHTAVMPWRVMSNIADVSLADVDLAAVAEEAISTSPRLMRVMHGVEWPRLRCPLTFLVLLIGVPHPKNKNLVVFEHIAEGLVKGMRDLGLEVELHVCPDMRQCTGEPLSKVNAQVIVLGTNAVHLFYFLNTTVPAAMGNDILPPSAVLYNFEYITHREVLGKHKQAWTDPGFLDVHRKYRVWEYSVANAYTWQEEFGIATELVRVGHAPGVLEVAQVAEEDKDIGVLFFGTGNEYRGPILDALRDANIPLTMAFGMFGTELYETVNRAKIVLNLRSFGYHDEFKMSRLMVLFANEAFVVSEDMGVPGDIDYYRPGMVNVPKEQLADTLWYYLKHPQERRRIAAIGKQLFRERSQAEEVRPAVQRLMREAGCDDTLPQSQ